MRTLFSTKEEAQKNSFRRWRETIFERIVPVELKAVGERSFQGMLEAAEVGPLLITRVTQSAVSTKATPATIRQHGKLDTLNVAIALHGQLFSAQDDRTSIQAPGDMVVLDRRPTTMMSNVDTQTMFIEIPRERIERILGTTRGYTALTIGAEQAGTSVVTKFFDELARTYQHLTPAMSARMAAIGIDLIVASIAERLAQQAPRSIQATLIVQRASAYIEANLGDPNLNSHQLAAAMGVSLRYLQTLFHEHDRRISDWIWRRRLEVAAHRLSDPGFAHIAVGALAYGCGFSNQSHFSRSFKNRYELTPSDYRWRALTASRQCGVHPV